MKRLAYLFIFLVALMILPPLAFALGIYADAPYSSTFTDQLQSFGSTVRVSSHTLPYQFIPGQLKVCHRLTGSGDWTTLCGLNDSAGLVWSWPAVEALAGTYDGIVPWANGTYGYADVTALAAGTQCFRTDWRSAASHKASSLGLSVNGTGVASSCCITVPSNITIECTGGHRLWNVPWTQARASEVLSWEVDWGTTHNGPYGNVAPSVTPPAMPPAEGIYSTALDVNASPTSDIYAVVKAKDSSNPALNSVASNEGNQLFVAGTPPTAQSSVVSATLWNASPNPATVINSSFQVYNGLGRILSAQRGCVAIEAVGNTYLNGAAGTPGSVEFNLDGAVSCQNNNQYSSSTTLGTNHFSCDSASGAIGLHTLTLIPYDADNCHAGGGVKGVPVVIKFNTLGP
jgi:hypothetical protein